MTRSVALHDAIAIICALLTALANGLGVTTQHIASMSATHHERGWRFVVFLLHHPLWLVGWLAMGGSLLFQSLALHFAAMSLVQPLLVFELVFALALRRVWLGQLVPARAWLASVVTVFSLGLFLFATTRTSGPPAQVLRWVGPGFWCSGVVVVLILAALRGLPGRRAALWGSATAILWALEAAYIKQCTDVITRDGYAGLFTRWPFYAFIVCGIAGLLTEQAALHAGPLRSSQATIVILDPIVSVLLGAWIFGEQLGVNWVWRGVAVVSLVFTLISAWVLISATPATMESALGPPALPA
ncbi:MAG: DMT family transporter [Acidimicrobiaceae bacterium]|nr:DMT family transporter [Acidimicrobiaceae bacterium]